MGWDAQRQGRLVLAIVVGTGCSAGVESGVGTFGGSVSVGSTKGDDPLDGGGETAESDGDEAEATGADSGAQDSGPGPEGGQDTSGADGATDDGAPAECGDGMVQGTEACDGTEVVGSCADYGFDDGILACDPECNHITDACFSCGDGSKSLGEACDGDDFGGATCTSLGFGSGSLLCSVDCQTVIDTGCEALPSCGDGQQNGGELCDGNDLGGATCATQGFDLGVLGCNANCTFDVGGCEHDVANCGQQGDFCIFSENDPQSTCCPAGVGGNVLGLCDIFVCI